jgi:YfiH family protein
MNTSFFSDFFSSHILTGVSDNRMDYTRPNDQESFSLEQQKHLSSFIGSSISKLVNVKQVHGNRILKISSQNSLKDKLEEADGLVTDQLGQPLHIRTADCLSIFMHDVGHNVIGLLHAGWKGTQQNIAGAAVDLMQKEWGVNPEQLKVAFGPSIHACCYEVGREFQKYFPQEVFQAEDKFYFDNVKANVHQLMRCGVPKENILDCGVCTYSDPHYFSYRRQGEKAGRMVSIMMLRE